MIENSIKKLSMQERRKELSHIVLTIQMRVIFQILPLLILKK